MEILKYKGIDEEIYYDELSNGLKVYLLNNKDATSTYMTLYTKYGSMDTEFKVDGVLKKVPNGIAHFLEHVNFNMDDNLTASDCFLKLGSDINAFTTFEYTGYEVFCYDKLKENLSLLLDYVMKPYFTQALIEKEKGIIKEEIKMDMNNPMQVLFNEAKFNILKKDKRRYLVTGLEEDVMSTTLEDVSLVHDLFYHPKNMFLVITGNFDIDEAMNIIRKNQEAKEFREYKNPIKVYEEETFTKESLYKEIISNVEVTKGSLSYKMPLSKFKMDKLLVNIYLSIILRTNFGSTSKFYEDLLESGLVTSFGCNRRVLSNAVLISFVFESDDPKKVSSLIDEKLKNLEVTRDDLVRRCRCNIASLVQEFDDIEYVNDSIAEDVILYGHPILDEFEIFNSLNIKDVSKVIDSISRDDKSLVVLKPKNRVS